MSTSSQPLTNATAVAPTSGATLDEPPRLTRADALLLFTLCFVFFCYSLVGGRPLSMHEAVLPQSAREMFTTHEWIVPTNGGRPWVENPPLPQWITVGIATAFGRCDEIWIVRMGAALAGAIGAVLGGWIASVW